MSPIVADVTKPQALRDAVAMAEREAPIDILVNNAGGVETGPFLRLGDDVFERQLALNLMGTVRMTRAVLPGMTERGFGRVINIASTAGSEGATLTFAPMSRPSTPWSASRGRLRSRWRNPASP